MEGTEIRAAILAALKMFPVVVTEKVVAELERRVLRRSPAPEQPVMFGFAVARNWAISEVRRKLSAARRQAEKILAADRKRQETKRRRMMRGEFERIVTIYKIVAELTSTQEKQLKAVRLGCFKGLKDPAVAEVFPGTTVDQRYQWKSRGIRLALKYASVELRKFLTEE